MGINKVILLGRVGKIETKTTQNGLKVSYLSFVTDTYYNIDGEKKQLSEWHRLVAFGKTAEVFEKYVTKGKQMYIEGRLQTRSYGDENDKKYITEVIVLDFQFTDASKKREETEIKNEELEEMAKIYSKSSETKSKSKELELPKEDIQPKESKFKSTKKEKDTVDDINKTINDVLGISSDVDIPF